MSGWWQRTRTLDGSIVLRPDSYRVLPGGHLYTRIRTYNASTKLQILRSFTVRSGCYDQVHTVFRADIPDASMLWLRWFSIWLFWLLEMCSKSSDGYCRGRRCRMTYRRPSIHWVSPWVIPWLLVVDLYSVQVGPRYLCLASRSIITLSHRLVISIILHAGCRCHTDAGLTPCHAACTVTLISIRHVYHSKSRTMLTSL